MVMENAQQTADLVTERFFMSMFGEREGFICISTGIPSGNKNANWIDQFFEWPAGKRDMLEYIDRSRHGHNVYFCAQLLDQPQRKKQFVSHVGAIWADLDTCDPAIVEPKPPIIFETSPGRYHAFWLLEEDIDPLLAENYSRRLHYKYMSEGADPSGWDLTQVLRVPYTWNYKERYRDPENNPPQVVVQKFTTARVNADVFDKLPPVDGLTEGAAPDIPKNLPLYPRILELHSARLPREFYELHDTLLTVDQDWSRSMWQLMMICYEAGMTPAEVYVVIRTSKIDKYSRDSRPPTHLWYDVLKAEQAAKLTVEYIQRRTLEFPELIKRPPSGKTFVEEYIAWASKQTDAATQYHEVTAFIMLSAILAGSLRMPLANLGNFTPNLWALILADTTLTRKTTAMKTGMDIVYEVDPDALLATDGSVEGMLKSLSTRPNKSSVFMRDEFAGFLDAAGQKQYMAGTLEMLAQLYDGTHMKRVLSKDTIHVNNPVVLLFAGGIKEKIVRILSDEHITSGFIPRFLIVMAESDIANMKPLAKRAVTDVDQRNKFIARLNDLRASYVTSKQITIAGQSTGAQMQQVYADISDDALELYNTYEKQMVEVGLSAEEPSIFTPVFDRMAKNILKMAMLLAAERQEPNDEFQITVELEDIERAAWYVQKWGHYMIELLRDVGSTGAERDLDRVLRQIKNHPGVTRGEVMRQQRLHAWQMQNIEQTLEQRQQIRIVQTGRMKKYFPIQ